MEIFIILASLGLFLLIVLIFLMMVLKRKNNNNRDRAKISHIQDIRKIKKHIVE